MMEKISYLLEVIGENIKWLLSPIISIFIFRWSAKKNKKDMTVKSLEILLNSAIREIYEMSDDSIEFVSSDIQKHDDYKQRNDLLDKIKKIEYYCACLNKKIYDFCTFKKIIVALFDRKKFIDKLQKVMDQYKEEDFRNIRSVIKWL